MPCGRYFDEKIDDYRSHKPDVLIVNVLFFGELTRADHLTFEQARRLIEAIRPKVVVMTHFGTTMLEHDPHTLARQLEAEMNVRAYAADDGWTLNVGNEVAGALRAG